MTADVELLACPFCGGQPYMKSDSDVDGCYWSKVRCGICDAATRGKWAISSANTCPQWYAEVREEWNTSANVSHATAAKDAEIEELRERLRIRDSELDYARDQWEKEQVRAERLAEALRLYMSAGFGNSTDFYKQAEAKRAATEALLREQEEGK